MSNDSDLTLHHSPINPLPGTRRRWPWLLLFVLLALACAGGVYAWPEITTLLPVLGHEASGAGMTGVLDDYVQTGNAALDAEDLEAETVRWCQDMMRLSPFALRLLKASFHASEDGYSGIQQLAHDANLLFYGSDEAKEGREAYKAKRAPDFGKFPKRP